jgi:maltose alpha-D-glucosyltransferase/alpha-amylase
VGEGVAARRSELMAFNADKYAMAYSLMLTLPGTPLVYYGDEFGKPNDEEYYREQVKKTGYADSRYLVRGRIDWDKWSRELEKPGSFHTKVYQALKKQLSVRKKTKVFGRGGIDWLEVLDNHEASLPSVLAFIRQYDEEQVMVLHNLSGDKQNTNLRVNFVSESNSDMLGRPVPEDEAGHLVLEPYAYHWFRLK